MVFYEKFKSTKDEEAFNALYFYCVPLIQSFVMRNFGFDEDLAKEVIAEFFDDFLSDKVNFDSSQGVGFLTFVYNCVSNKASRKKSTGSKFISINQINDIASENYIEREYEKIERIFLANKAIKKLPSPYKEVLGKAMELGNIREVAKVLGQKIPTTETIYRRGIILFRKLFL